MLKQKHVFVILLFIFVMILSVWLINMTDRLQFSPNKDENPNGFMHDVTIIRTNSSGQPNVRLETPEINMYQKMNSSMMKNPRVNIHNDLVSWTIQSNQGKTYDHPQKIMFEGEVLIHKYAKDEAPVLIETDSMMIDPEKSLAKTDDVVTITQVDNKIKGKGLVADLKTGDIQIVSQTQENYVVNKQYR